MRDLPIFEIALLDYALPDQHAMVLQLRGRDLLVVQALLATLENEPEETKFKALSELTMDLKGNAVKLEDLSLTSLNIKFDQIPSLLSSEKNG